MVERKNQTQGEPLLIYRKLNINSPVLYVHVNKNYMVCLGDFFKPSQTFPLCIHWQFGLKKN